MPGARRAVKAAITLAGIVLTISFAVAYWQAASSRRVREAQCAAARPLVAEGKGRDAFQRLRERPPSEYSARDAEQLARTVAGGSDHTARNIREHLRGRNSVLVFSESDSIMFVYFDERGRAFRADCFLR